MNIRKLVSKTKPINHALYGSYTNAELVTYATWLLVENKIESRFENIVVMSHKLFPEKFSMEEFPEHPHGYRIYNSVRRDAYKGGLLGGNMEILWSLTNKGTSRINYMKSIFDSFIVTTKGHIELNKKINPEKLSPITQTLFDELPIHGKPLTPEDLKKINININNKTYNYSDTTIVFVNLLDILSFFPRIKITPNNTSNGINDVLKNVRMITVIKS